MSLPGTSSQFTPDLRFKQYQLMVESAERNSDRRERTQNHYTTIHTSLLTLLAIIAGYGLITGGIGGSNVPLPGTGFLTQAQAPIILAVSAIGIILCIIWRLHLNAYRRLSTAKFAVINHIENDLPYQAYQMEWDALQKIKHTDLTSFERYVPAIAAMLYFVLAATYGAFALVIH